MTIRIYPHGESVAGIGLFVESTQQGHALFTSPLGQRFIDDFAGAQMFAIDRYGAGQVEVPLSSASAAVSELRRCEAAVLRDWGVDPTIFDRVRSLPDVNMAAVFTDSDYPEAALRGGLAGDSVARLTIDVHGRPTDCATVAGSGHRILDARTRQVLMERGRTSPTLDQSGTPISVPLIVSIRWRMY